MGLSQVQLYNNASVFAKWLYIIFYRDPLWKYEPTISTEIGMSPRQLPVNQLPANPQKLIRSMPYLSDLYG